MLQEWRTLLLSHGATGLWPLSDGIGRTTGATVHDLSGRERHGTHNDGELYVNQPGPRMSGVPCTQSPSSGHGDHIVVAHGTWLDQQALTVEFWFRSSIDITGTACGLMGRDPGSGGSRPWVVNMINTGVIQAYSNNSAGPVKATTRTGLDDQRWHHFAWAYEASGGTGMHVVDGEIDNTYTGGGTLATTTDPMRIFNSRSGTVNAWPGWMALVAFFPSKLTAAQIRSHYDLIAGRT